ncbi:hypothetical protein [Bradyrhizobium prioriisuperbiae]|uniref:terminase small subunit-like protein n=1 Tax=Bradyrhizobium prioriisuperbiae TaxID=2854389 RepID=UPI0028E9E0EB|nr:hypothetical protein [Bradyrhizobium prioritasuperba]
MRRRYVPYSAAIANRICNELARGRTVKDICTDDGMPNAWTVHQWVRENRAGFGDRYKTYPHSRGVPLLYTPEIADDICGQLSAGRTLSDVCSEAGMPSADAVFGWVKADRDGFAARYWQAREFGYLVMADAILDIADNARNDWMERRSARGGVHRVFNRENVMRSRARVTARCWILSKVMPRVFKSSLDVQARPEQPHHTWADLLKEIDGRSRGLPPKSDGCPYCRRPWGLKP